MNRILGVFVLSLLGISAMAQSKSNVQVQVQNMNINTLLSNTVSGKVEDETKKPLGSITVCLIELPAKSSILLSRTNASGTYSFKNVPAGSYLIQTIQVGKQKKLSEPFTVEPIGETLIKPITMASGKTNSSVLDSLKSVSKSL